MWTGYNPRLYLPKYGGSHAVGTTSKLAAFVTAQNAVYD